jgi:hypothetical protein
MSSGYLEMDESSPVTLESQAHGGGVFSTVAVPLVVRTTAPSLELPAGMVKWSHLEIIIEKGSAAALSTGAISFKAYVTWDANGIDIAAGPTQTSLTMVKVDRNAPYGGTADSGMASATLDISPSRPPDGEVSKAYVWLDTTGFHQSTIGSTVNLKPIVVRCRLYWHSLSKG